MQKADTVFTNGKIYTVDSARSWAEAIAIQQGKIVFVGSNKDAQAYAGPATRNINLHGNMMLPGIGDVHNHHMIGGSADAFEIKFSASNNIEEILACVNEQAKKIPANEWIIGGSWSSELLGEIGTMGALKRLDEASLGRPVMLRDDSLHNRWINTKALELTEITDTSPDPKDGEILRDPSSGQAVGLMMELASALVETACRNSMPDLAQRNIKSVARALEILNAYGVTSYQDATTNEFILSALKHLDAHNKMTAWCVTSLPAFETLTGAGLYGDALIAKRKMYTSNHVRPNFVKFFMDGVPTTKTAAMLDAYLPDENGQVPVCHSFIPVPEMVRWIFKAEKMGMSIKVHCTGDRAVRDTLDAIEIVRDINGNGPWHHIAHPGFVHPDDVQRFADLKVVADLCPAIWVPSPIISAINSAIPFERSSKYWPFKDFKEAGVLMAGGSDWPVLDTPDPWFGMEGMITRKNPNGTYPGALWPEQSLDITTVIDIYTRNPATAMGLDDITGSIELGKSADLVVIDRNLMEIPASEISKTNVLETWFEGNPVYENG